MAQKNRISETEWKQLLPQMASFAHITTDIGYSVLVKGEKSSDVATRVGRSKQNISSTVKRIWDLYQNTTLKAENGEPLKLVQVWILNRPGFPGECFICELRLPDHRFRWKH
ncbi:TrfB-related DNA-binding protein, partial [Escherichia coli]|uniref:TrfB-related DNA-binding protein n=1 Tax=Escherichia coli TaxID=562 RepID=UPI00202CFF3B